MPELPEVETIRRGLAPLLEGATVTGLDVRRPDLRYPFPTGFAERITGRQIETVSRRAKYLLFDLSSGETLIVHLGMSGRLSVVMAPGRPNITLGEYIYDTGALPQHDHVIFELQSGDTVIYNDPRRFGFMLLADTNQLGQHKSFAGLGVEPLSDGLTASYLASRAHGRSADLKSFLLDQRNIAGLGNIYVCEALFRAGLSPRRSAGTLSRAGGQPHDRTFRLVPEIKSVLIDAIAAGGSSLRDYRQADGTSGRFQETFAVYDREGQPCMRPGCAGMVKRLVQAQRSSFYCAACQR
ncbi:MAG: bifunctional DNA-formamidopyrimidine glycosylase/DNA-(apurinic or apyrimidinic site) lyase [Hyphomicrobiaceae bacterium]|nr:bifunctional DNA-formamidopyrimidine glycosylase/DNA-(apurinic or apyrimidinic site) lyase [Hyphomicrobiaceae bacterium]